MITDDQHNQFFHTLMEKGCWHELAPNSFICSICHKTIDVIWEGNKIVPDNPDYLSNPMLVIKWVQEHYPQHFEAYLARSWDDYEEFQVARYTVLESILDLRNLTQYMKENPEWGEKKCPEWKDCQVETIKYGCDKCNDTGTIIHPALKFLRGIE